MKNKRIVWIPAIFIALVSLALLAYYVSLEASHAGRVFVKRPHLPKTGAIPPMGEKEGRGSLNELVKFGGQVSIFAAMVSFWWFLLKSKRRSSSTIVKSLSKFLFKIHTYVAWVALTVAAAHGVYFFLNEFNKPDVWSGMAALLVFFTMAMYGLFVRKSRNPYVRKTHRFLSFLWVPLLLVHAGGTVISAVFCTVVLYVAIRVAEKQATAS